MLPIIFIHNRNSSYLPISLWKARQSNPDSEIYLIGDVQNAHFGAIVSHVYQSRFFKKANEFAKKFKNFSSNPHHFELICLQRWMVLEEFMKAKNISSCLYIDSDVLLFDDIQSDARRFSDFGMTVAGISGHTNFVNGLTTLPAFCGYIENSYTDENSIDILSQKYLKFKETHTAGGISDMTMFTEFREANPGKVLDIAEPLAAKIFDITITYTKGVRSENGIKKIEWKAGIPFAETTENEKVELRSLHFQGESKSMMKSMAQINSLTFNAIYQINLVYLFGQKVWNRIFR